MPRCVGPILISVFLGMGGTIPQGYIPGMKATIFTTVEIIIPEGSNINQEQKIYSDLKKGKWKWMRNENTRGPTTQTYQRENNVLNWSLLGEERALRHYESGRLLHGWWGAPWGFLAPVQGVSVSTVCCELWRETWSSPQMQWLHYHVMCLVNWGCHWWQF